MANSRFEYVKTFERENFLLPETHIVIRIDGRGFHKLSSEYEFEKPNDMKALQLMNQSALKVMEDYPDVIMAYGDSDEYSFLLRKNCQLFERREMKLVTSFSSSFTANYQFMWNQFFPEKPLKLNRLPQFDARAVLYPNISNIRDYFSWRQVDCHINNLYNTTFWKLVELGQKTPQEAENMLIGTLASDKNEILFKNFKINYNNEPEIFKKGTLIIREIEGKMVTKDFEEEQENGNGNETKTGTSSSTSTRITMSKKQQQKLTKRYKKADLKVYHKDIINDDQFWFQFI